MWGKNIRGCLGIGRLEDQYFPWRVRLGWVMPTEQSLDGAAAPVCHWASPSPKEPLPLLAPGHPPPAPWHQVTLRSGEGPEQAPSPFLRLQGSPP